VIRVVKDTQPDDPQDFQFSSPQLGDFVLDDDSDTTCPNSRIYVIIDSDPDLYTVTEQLMAGWKLTDIAIEDPDGGSSFDVNAGTATLDWDLGSSSR